MVIYGHRLYGKVDAVPGVGHVATKFFHLDFVPLVPTETWLVTQQSGKSWRGVKIPFSAKSIFMAWGRAACLMVGVGAAIAALVQGIGGRTDTAVVVGWAVISAAAWALFALVKTHRLFNRASYPRACQLAKALQMNDTGLAALAAAYGEPLPTFGFRPAMQPKVAAVPVAAAPVPVEVLEAAPVSLVDEPTTVAPPRAAAPLRGY